MVARQAARAEARSLHHRCKRMRRQEKAWGEGRKEIRKQYLARLRRTAFRLPAGFLNGCVGDMRRRCQRLKDAKGRHFEEGGK